MAIEVRRSRSSYSVGLGEVRRYVHHSLGDLRHERRVLAIASRLFDLTQPLHQLSNGHRRLLQLGALLHDVGRCHGDRRHHIRGSRMVLASHTLQLADEEREIAAYLTRFHRGRLPRWGEGLDDASDENYRQAMVLLALLRAADSLDSCW